MSIAKSAIDVGNFLLQYWDIIDDIRDALSRGVTKEALKKSIQELQTKISDDALREELESAEERKKNFGF